MNLKTFPLRINGNSMKPLLRDQDEVEVLYFDKPKQVSELTVGKVVLLRQTNEWIIHRVLLEEKELRTKGDWSMHFDEKFSVWGEVVSINGEKNSLLSCEKMSLLSKGITSKNHHVIRKFNRLKLLTYVLLIKLIKRVR